MDLGMESWREGKNSKFLSFHEHYYNDDFDFSIFELVFNADWLLSCLHACLSIQSFLQKMEEKQLDSTRKFDSMTSSSVYSSQSRILFHFLCTPFQSFVKSWERDTHNQIRDWLWQWKGLHIDFLDNSLYSSSFDWCCEAPRLGR
jgi:hypothetical protein